MSGIDQTAPAQKFILYASGALPVAFTDRRPKAVIIPTSGDVVLKDRDGNATTFTPAVGVPLPVSPTEITSITMASIIAIFD